MIRAENKTIKMVEGDFGLPLPITVTGTTISNDETIKITINNMEKEEIFSQEYKDIKNNTFDLIFTEEQSKELKEGMYTYSIDWFKGTTFLGNIVNGEMFEVEGK